MRKPSTVTFVRARILILFSLVLALLSLGLAPALAVDERVIDIVSVNWSGSAVLPAGVDQLATTVNTEVNSNWRSFTTLYGATSDKSISFVAGKILTAPITLNSKMPCVGKEALTFMYSTRAETYKRLGIDDYSNRYLIIAAPKAGCVWSGRAPLGDSTSTSGVLVLHDSGSGFVITHELGHTFGLGHTNFLRCDNKTKDGPWSTTCKAVEYGGTIDVMGNVDTKSPLNTYHQWRMGLLSDSEVKQVWQTETVTLAPSDFANGLRAIYIRDGGAAYWIEYRRTLNGVGYKPGLVIFRVDPPPITSVVSPNPEDAAASEFGSELGTDVWMLNLDSFSYTNSNTTGGSMTGLTATTFSGQTTLRAIATENGASVTITRKSDVTPPPVPVLMPFSEWRYPAYEIVKSGNQDADTEITAYQATFNGVIKDLPPTPSQLWSPSYLSPFSAPITVQVKDLPEGNYTLALRAIDRAGNQSAWSPPMNVTVDRGRPVLTNDFSVSAINGSEISLAWNGVKDTGSGLCQINLVNDVGFVVQSSSAKASPTFTLENGAKLKVGAQVFDCIGNGTAADLAISNTVIAGDKSSRTGKWITADLGYGAGAIKCVGKCTASFSASGHTDILVGNGAATVSVGNKIVASISDSKSSKLRVGASVDLGNVKKVVRISGSNFVFVARSILMSELSNLKQFDRKPATVDASLSDPKQMALSKFGFSPNDFSQEWNVLPMTNGTTLQDPSLDLCNGTYPSEKNRIERRQVIATKEKSGFTFLSTETVRYKSALAAQTAQKELLSALTKCQSDKGYTSLTGAQVSYRFSEIKNIPSGLVPEGARVLVRTQIDSGASAAQLLGIYQFNGDLLTGLYVMKSGETGFSDAQITSWLQVAVLMAARLSPQTFA